MSIARFRQSTPLIHVVNISDQIIARLCANPDDLSQLSPDGFELLVGDRLTTMGLGVQRVGSVNCRDGGIDLIAWPERNAAIPYLLAVQVKHSRAGHTVSSRVVRDLKGVLSVTPFDFGLIVTNTTFSPDARWFAREKPNIIRLRDFEDLVRWVRSDFANESLDRDLPSEISLAPGLRIQIRPKKSIDL
jgi:restriction system protein